MAHTLFFLAAHESNWPTTETINEAVDGFGYLGRRGFSVRPADPTMPPCRFRERLEFRSLPLEDYLSLYSKYGPPPQA